MFLTKMKQGIIRKTPSIESFIKNLLFKTLSMNENMKKDIVLSST